MAKIRCVQLKMVRFSYILEKTNDFNDEKKKERIRKFLMALHNDREKANGPVWLGKKPF